MCKRKRTGFWSFLWHDAYTPFVLAITKLLGTCSNYVLLELLVHGTTIQWFACRNRPWSLPPWQQLFRCFLMFWDGRTAAFWGQVITIDDRIPYWQRPGACLAHGRWMDVVRVKRLAGVAGLGRCVLRYLESNIPSLQQRFTIKTN